MNIRHYFLAIACPAVMMITGSAAFNNYFNHDKCEKKGYRFTMSKMDDPFYHTELRLGYRGYFELDTGPWWHSRHYIDDDGDRKVDDLKVFNLFSLGSSWNRLERDKDLTRNMDLFKNADSELEEQIERFSDLWGDCAEQ